MSESSPRILLVEDERPLVRTLTDMLSASGCTVTACEDGKEALEEAGSKAYDLIILDVMPSLGGSMYVRPCATAAYKRQS